MVTHTRWVIVTGQTDEYRCNTLLSTECWVIVEVHSLGLIQLPIGRLYCIPHLCLWHDLLHYIRHCRFRVKIKDVIRWLDWVEHFPWTTVPRHLFHVQSRSLAPTPRECIAEGSFLGHFIDGSDGLKLLSRWNGIDNRLRSLIDFVYQLHTRSRMGNSCGDGMVTSVASWLSRMTALCTAVAIRNVT